MNLHPLSGHWTGDPQVSLVIDKANADLEIVVPSGVTACLIAESTHIHGSELSITDLDGNTITGTFSDTTHISGTYHVIACGSAPFGPVDGTWSASLKTDD